MDGIENAPTFIKEKLSFLCGKKPELNLYEKNMKPISTTKGFHLFITYNSGRVLHNNPLPNSLLDKCLIYNLKSFVNDQISISQIIYGYLVNLDFCNQTDILYDISSRISKIHNIIKEQLSIKNIDDISERTIINYCNKLNNDNLPLSLKQNFLYYYFPSANIEEQEVYKKIIDDNIGIKGIEFTPLATAFQIECKESLFLLNLIREGNNFHLNFGIFLCECLKSPFKYISKLKKSISETIQYLKDNNYKGIYLPLNIFVNYFDKINLLLEKQNKINLNETKIRDNINFPCIRILNLFEQLYKANLISWDCIDLIFEKTDIFYSIEEMHKKQNIDSLQNFLKIITDKKTICFINDIIKIFPYDKFIKTNLFLINDILKYIIQNTSNNKINFKIDLNKNIYYFKFVEEDNNEINIFIDLKFNNNNELIISKETAILIPLILKEKKISLESSGVEESYLNKFFLKLIEQICNTKIIKKKEI